MLRASDDFGFERLPGKSAKRARSVLLPAVRATDRDRVILADGFSGRPQIQQLAGNRRRALHLAELLVG